MNSIQIFDSTLRDGAQAEGIAFSVEDKLNIIKALDKLGVDFAEAGNPGSNPKDAELFERLGELKLSHTKPVAFGATRRKYTAVSDDDNIKALLAAGTEWVAVFGKSSALHVEKILGASKKENLAMISDTCRYLCENGKRAIFDAEHFFDGYKLNPDYAVKSLKAAAAAGADIINLCDTNGGTFPFETDSIVKAVKAELPDAIIGIHNHNDNGCAVANTVTAVMAGAEHVQGTYLGFGERCGNTALSAVIPNLQIKCGISCIPEQNLHLITPIANEIAQICNISIKRNEPFVGRSAFAHKAGMHVDGVLKYHSSFEHIDPESIGNTRRILMSEMSGRTAVLRKIDKIVQLDHSSPELARILSELKRLEYIGYQFDGADGSFEMLVRKVLGMFRSSFELISYKVLDELPYDNSHSSTATIKIKVNDAVKISAADGDGPVNALDKALREALSAFYPKAASAHLIDYKVRVMEPKDATAAVVRVLITSTDGNEVWTTVGVSKDVIEASWLALVDSIEYTLVNREK